MAETRAERRLRERFERRAATKVRLALPPVPPTVPVALPWSRRVRPQRVLAEELEWSPVVSHDAHDLEGALAMAATFVCAIGPVLRGRRP